ncbi:amidohydrolase family protein [Corynebacterium lowii]|uniref:Amidohydrolase n=1 Tax=Corynebacterium lowii TaxID=1544413 RepID=A0A0Q0Z987_9CORY|nr:amidohydrolase family protein [Corynebacterium lowii]KQB86176.1 Amidohydrolase [Corynebacterium lowii]MDP9852650.1 putative TIM-barrel fold metal-dependent hydrolase [Corynebacterium lowii]
MLITDAHIHLWENDQAPAHHRGPLRIDEALAMMDAAGIDRAVNCPAIWDDQANDYAAQAASAHPERFATLGWFPLDDKAGPERVESTLSKPGVLGLRFVLYSSRGGAALESGALDCLWEIAHRRGLPVALMVMPEHLGAVERIAERYPNMRLMLDHLCIGPHLTLPRAAEHLDGLLRLARFPNVAVKATGVPSMATDAYPFRSTHLILRRTVEAFGPQRTFWGTDITRLHCSWAEALDMMRELPWLSADDLEFVLGRGISQWIGWPEPTTASTAGET